MRITVDTQHFPMVVIRLPEEPSVEELERHFRDQIPPLLHKGTISTVVDASATKPLAFSTEHRAVAAKWYQTYRADFLRVLCAEAYYLPSPVARGVLRVIHLVSPPAWPSAIFGTYSEAWAWAESKWRTRRTG